MSSDYLEWVKITEDSLTNFSLPCYTHYSEYYDFRKLIIILVKDFMKQDAWVMNLLAILSFNIQLMQMYNWFWWSQNSLQPSKTMIDKLSSRNFKLNVKQPTLSVSDIEQAKRVLIFSSIAAIVYNLKLWIATWHAWSPPPSIVFSHHIMIVHLTHCSFHLLFSFGTFFIQDSKKGSRCPLQKRALSLTIP